MTELRETFDAVAELYDRVRPTYPPALFDELFARLPAVAEIAEIGPGTGQATGSLLARRARVTAVELGPNMAAVLQRKFVGDGNLRVVVSAFEDTDLRPHSFDAVVSATSFHWVPQPFRMEKTAEVLRRGGWLAVIESIQVAATTDRGFFDRARHVYDRYGDDSEQQPPPTPESASSQFLDELRDSPRFEQPILTRYRWDQTYSTAAYIDLMQSFSVTQAMPNAQRAALLSDMAAFIDEEFEGSVTRPLVIALTMARANQ